MARHYRVKSFWRSNWGGRVVVLLEGADSSKSASWNLAAGNYFCEVESEDENLIGWELTNSEKFFQSGGFTEFQEPAALMIDPEFAPEGAKLTDLVRRVFDRRHELEAQALAERDQTSRV